MNQRDHILLLIGDAVEALIALADALQGDPDIEATAVETAGCGFLRDLSCDDMEDDREAA